MHIIRPWPPEHCRCHRSSSNTTTTHHQVMSTRALPLSPVLLKHHDHTSSRDVHQSAAAVTSPPRTPRPRIIKPCPPKRCHCHRSSSNTTTTHHQAMSIRALPLSPVLLKHHDHASSSHVHQSATTVTSPPRTPRPRIINSCPPKRCHCHRSSSNTTTCERQSTRRQTRRPEPRQVPCSSIIMMMTMIMMITINKRCQAQQTSPRASLQGAGEFNDMIQSH